MSQPQLQWYIIGKNYQTRGPFTTAYILKRCLSGKYGQNTLCWRDGMPEWLPLMQIDIFQAEIETFKRLQGKIHFYCRCGNEIFAGKALAGKTIGNCGKCNQPLVVPFVSQPHPDLVSSQPPQPQHAPPLPRNAAPPQINLDLLQTPNLPTDFTQPLPRKQTHSWLTKIPTGIYGLVIICFLLPFIEGMPVAELSGINLVTGTTIEQSSQIDYEMQDLFGDEFKDEQEEAETDKKIESRTEAIIAFAAAILALLLTRIPVSRWIPAALGVLGFICLIWLKINLDQETKQEGEGILEVTYLYGYWLALLAFASACIAQGVLIIAGVEKKTLLPNL